MFFEKLILRLVPKQDGMTDLQKVPEQSRPDTRYRSFMYGGFFAAFGQIDPGPVGWSY